MLPSATVWLTNVFLKVFDQYRHLTKSMAQRKKIHQAFITQAILVSCINSLLVCLLWHHDNQTAQKREAKEINTSTEQVLIKASIY